MQQPRHPGDPDTADQITDSFRTVRSPRAEVPGHTSGAQGVVDTFFGAFITPVVASVFFVLLLLVGAVVAGWLILTGTFSEEPAARALLVIPAYVIGLLLVRIVLETAMVLFRIEEHLRAIRHGR